MSKIPQPRLRPGIYQHYKGQFYYVLGLARMDETHELYVMYLPLYPIADVNVQTTLRPLREFLELIPVAGQEVAIPRFRHLPAGPALTKEGQE